LLFEKLASEEPEIPAQFANTPPGRFFEKMRSHPHLSQRKLDVEEEIGRTPAAVVQPIDVDCPALAKAAEAPGAVNRPPGLPAWLVP